MVLLMKNNKTKDLVAGKYMADRRLRIVQNGKNQMHRVLENVSDWESKGKKEGGEDEE